MFKEKIFNIKIKMKNFISRVYKGYQYLHKSSYEIIKDHALLDSFNDSLLSVIYGFWIKKITNKNIENHDCSQHAPNWLVKKVDDSLKYIFQVSFSNKANQKIDTTPTDSNIPCLRTCCSSENMMVQFITPKSPKRRKRVESKKPKTSSNIIEVVEDKLLYLCARFLAIKSIEFAYSFLYHFVIKGSAIIAYPILRETYYGFSKSINNPIFNQIKNFSWESYKFIATWISVAPKEGIYAADTALNMENNLIKSYSANDINLRKLDHEFSNYITEFNKDYMEAIVDFSIHGPEYFISTIKHIDVTALLKNPFYNAESMENYKFIIAQASWMAGMYWLKNNSDAKEESLGSLYQNTCSSSMLIEEKINYMEYPLSFMTLGVCEEKYVCLIDEQY